MKAKMWQLWGMWKKYISEHFKKTEEQSLDLFKQGVDTTRPAVEEQPTNLSYWVNIK